MCLIFVERWVKVLVNSFCNLAANEEYTTSWHTIGFSENTIEFHMHPQECMIPVPSLFREQIRSQ